MNFIDTTWIVDTKVRPLLCKNHDKVTTAFLRRHENGGKKTMYMLTSPRAAHHDALLPFPTRSSCRIHTSRYLMFH